MKVPDRKINFAYLKLLLDITCSFKFQLVSEKSSQSSYERRSMNEHSSNTSSKFSAIVQIRNYCIMGLFKKYPN